MSIYFSVKLSLREISYVHAGTRARVNEAKIMHIWDTQCNTEESPQDTSRR